MINHEAINFPVFNSINLNWSWYNACPFEDYYISIMKPGEYWACFCFEKPNPRPGENKYFTTEVVKYLIPKGFDLFEGKSFNMN